MKGYKNLPKQYINMMNNQHDESSRFTATFSSKLKGNLESISEETGLSQSEIVRRGTLEEIKKLSKSQSKRSTREA